MQSDRTLKLPDNTLNFSIEVGVQKLGISSLAQWDVLVFLYRHHVSLASFEQIARLLGYPCQVVADALDRLESLRLIEGSRNSERLRMYRVNFSEPQSTAGFEEIIQLSESRAGRIVLAKKLRDPHVGSRK